MDAAEFKRLFLPLHPRLYRVAYRLTGDAQDAEDTVQDAYLKLWQRRDELAGVQCLEAYCVTLVKNLCYDAFRLVRPDEDGRPPEELDLMAETDIARDTELHDEVVQLRKLIGRLPARQRQVLVMHDMDDRSYEEIGQLTGLSAVNIRAMLSRARKKIREQFNALISYENR